jgi:hypothetical protein
VRISALAGHPGHPAERSAWAIDTCHESAMEAGRGN